MKHLRGLGIALVIIVAWGVVWQPFSTPQAEAFSVRKRAITLDCVGMWDYGFIVSLDRDNTGHGKEAYRLLAYDGAGNILFKFSGAKLLGDQYLSSQLVPWSITPQANPLTLYLTSLAGNGYPEQTEVIAVGECAWLPLRPQPPDARLNWRHGDLDVVVYASGPDLHFYQINHATSQGNLIFVARGSEWASFIGSPPATNTLIRAEGDARLYALTSGWFAVHIGPDAEGDVWAWVFDGLSPYSGFHTSYNMYR